MPLAALGSSGGETASVRRVAAGFVFEQRHDGICPVRDVVQRLLITDRPEAGYQDVQLLSAERTSGADADGVLDPADIGFGLSSCGEPCDRLVIPDDLGQLSRSSSTRLRPSGVSASIALARYSE